MPKFILGFIGTSLLFSFIVPKATVDSSLPIINGFRELFFTFAFVSIGLESNFRDIRELSKLVSPYFIPCRSATEYCYSFRSGIYILQRYLLQSSNIGCRYEKLRAILITIFLV